MQTNANSIRVAPCVVSDKIYCFDGNKILGMLDGKSSKFEATDDKTTDGASVGRIDFQGQPIPVYQLSKLLGLAQSTRGETDGVAIVIATDSGPQGFIVDDALRSREPQRLLPLPTACRNSQHPFFDGVAIWDSDESLSQTHEAVALRLSADGLIGSTPKLAPSYTETQIDVKAFSHMVSDRRRQLMLFDVPHQDWENQIISVALSVTQVLEIVTPEPLIEIPHAPNGAMGLVHWRDWFIPVIDLTENLALGSIPESARRRIVIARDAENLFAFYTSTSIRTLAKPLSDAKAIDMGKISESKWAKGTFSVSEEVIVLPRLAV